MYICKTEKKGASLKKKNLRILLPFVIQLARQDFETYYLLEKVVNNVRMLLSCAFEVSHVICRFS